MLIFPAVNNLWNKYLFLTYHMPGTLLNPQDTVVGRAGRDPITLDFPVQQGERP